MQQMKTGLGEKRAKYNTNRIVGNLRYIGNLSGGNSFYLDTF